ncbi:hypothetical protein ACWDX8_37325, partial [Streptomyces anthocyanicus]
MTRPAWTAILGERPAAQVTHRRRVARHRLHVVQSVDTTSSLAPVRKGEVTWADVVEETLRHEPAVKHLP